MRFGSVCSGIEAASQAWNVLGWEAAFFSEIEPFPCAVLAHHHPHVPNHGDMTKFAEWPDHAIDLLVGGTPCQSFSVAGLRAGLADPRGNLMLTYLAIAARYQPRWLVWENVPGVLSSNDGRDFGTFLGALGELGYGFAYRVLDAQFCRAHGYDRAVPQRRRRVFVVGYLGDWRRAAAVLFDGKSLRGDPAPSRGPGEVVTGTIDAGTHPGSYSGQDAYQGRLVAHSLRGEGFDASEDGTGRGTPLIAEPIALMSNASGVNFNSAQGFSPTLRVGGDGGNAMAIAFDTTQITSAANYSNPQPGDPCHPLASGAHPPAVATEWAVRRLTPVECCRLQGFPDDHFEHVIYRGKKPADGPIYKALGNSMAVNAMRVLGTRIQMIEELAA